jgi:UPF0716 protein FxsA
MAVLHANLKVFDLSGVPAMLIRLLAAFILVPLIELFLLLQLAQYTSVATTVLVVVITGIIGSMLARREGVMAWTRFRSALAEGRMPSREIQDGLMIVFAAALLLTPGLLTDALGFLLLLPVGRDFIRSAVFSRFVGRFNIQVTTAEAFQDDPLEPQPLHRTRRSSAYTVEADAFQRKH